MIYLLCLRLGHRNDFHQGARFDVVSKVRVMMNAVCVLWPTNSSAPYRAAAASAKSHDIATREDDIHWGD